MGTECSTGRAAEKVSYCYNESLLLFSKKPLETEEETPTDDGLAAEQNVIMPTEKEENKKKKEAEFKKNKEQELAEVRRLVWEVGFEGLPVVQLTTSGKYLIGTS